jgi:hypothetical protein
MVIPATDRRNGIALGHDCLLHVMFEIISRPSGTV